jgi:hypothetical protein
LRNIFGSIKLIGMAETHQTFIGIDVQAGTKPYFYTALDPDLEIIACGHGRLVDVLAYLSGQSSAVVAVNGPICVQLPDQESLQVGLFDTIPSMGNQVSQRTGDDALIARGYPHVVSTRKPPLWVERSLELADGVRQLGYHQGNHDGEPRVWFETQSDAAYWLSTGTLPYESRSLEGRLQRQLLLCEFGFALKDPMAFLEEFTRFRLLTSQVPMEQILPAHELRALIAASTAWLADMRPAQVDQFGETNKGEIILPRELIRKQNT